MNKIDKITAKLIKIEIYDFNTNYIFSSVDVRTFPYRISAEQICALSKTNNPIGLQFVICLKENFEKLQNELKISLEKVKTDLESEKADLETSGGLILEELERKNETLQTDIKKLEKENKRYQTEKCMLLRALKNTDEDLWLKKAIPYIDNPLYMELQKKQTLKENKK